jgi:hypothetical protein
MSITGIFDSKSVHANLCVCVCVCVCVLACMRHIGDGSWPERVGRHELVRVYVLHTCVCVHVCVGGVTVVYYIRKGNILRNVRVWGGIKEALKQQGLVGSS